MAIHFPPRPEKIPVRVPKRPRFYVGGKEVSPAEWARVFRKAGQIRPISGEEVKAEHEATTTLQMVPASDVRPEIGNRLPFELTRSRSQTGLWEITGPGGFYLAVHSEALGEAIVATLRQMPQAAAAFARAFLVEKGLVKP